LGLKHNLGLLVPAATYTKVAETKAHRPNIAIHMSAVTWTAKVRGLSDDKIVTFNLRKMERREQHRFRRELV
jgi:hypothetical protein